MSLSQYTKDTPRVIVHRTIELPVDWYEFTTRLEHRLGRFNPVTLAASTSVEELENAVLVMRKKEPFSIYAIYDHGFLSTLAGQPRRAKQYIIGDSRVATSMSVHDIRVAQNLPLQNLIHEMRPGFTTIEFESAPSLLAALTDENVEVGKISRRLDEMREGVFYKIYEDVKAGRVGGNGL